MPVLHAIVLGIVQGLSEFLPISSSAHLRIVPWLLGWDDFAGDPSLARSFDVALHVGTLAGAATYFRRDLARLARGLVPLIRRPVTVGVGAVTSDAPGDPTGGGGQRQAEGRFAVLLLISALPAAAVGAVLELVFASPTGPIALVAVLLVVFGLVLLWADRAGGNRPERGWGARDALVMGIAQAAALEPGVSRSGVTITAARALGFERYTAARLSFLMSLPVILGAGLLKLGQSLAGAGLPSDLVAPFAFGVGASAVSGWVAVWGTLRLVRTRSFSPFVAYRVVVGLGVLAVTLSGWR